MRKMVAYFLPAILASIAGILLMLGHLYPASHSPTVEPSAPIASAPVDLPECVGEDGAGMPLCMYQGSYGPIVSGDCAPDIVGGSEASALCVELHSMPASTYTYQDAEITIPTGADRVSGCTDARESTLSMIDCFRGQILMGGIE